MLRKQIRSSSRRRKILDAAARLFGRHGYRGTSMEMIAAAAGVAKPSIYHYFPTKRHLFTTLLEEAAESLDELARTEGQRVAGRPLRLVAKYLRRNSHLLGVVIATHAAGFEQLRKLIGAGPARRIEMRHRQVFGDMFASGSGKEGASLSGELIECVMLGLGLKMMYGRQTDVEGILGLLEGLMARDERRAEGENGNE